MEIPTITKLAVSSKCLEFTYNSSENLIKGEFENDLTGELYYVEVSYDEVADQIYDWYRNDKMSDLDYLYFAFNGEGKADDDGICEAISYALEEKVCFGSLSIFKRALDRLYMEKKDEADYYLDEWLKAVA